MCYLIIPKFSTWLNIYFVEQQVLRFILINRTVGSRKYNYEPNLLLTKLNNNLAKFAIQIPVSTMVECHFES